MKKILSVLALLVTSLALPAVGQAQGGGCPCQGGEGECRCLDGEPGPGMMPGPELDEGRFERMQGRLLREKVGLSEEEAAKVEAVFKKDKEAHKALRAKSREAHKALRELLKADSNDMAAYAKAIATLEASKAEMEALMDSHKAEIAKILNPKQQARLMLAMKRLMMKAKGGCGGPDGEGGPGCGHEGPGRPHKKGHWDPFEHEKNRQRNR